MNPRRGFAAIVPLLLLAFGLVAAVYLVGKQTIFKNRASGLAETIPNPTAWGNAANFGSSNSSNYLDVPPITIINPFTIEVWVKVPKPTSGNYLKDYSLITQTKTQTVIDFGYVYRLSLETQDTSGTSRPMFSVLKTNSLVGANNYANVGAQNTTGFPAETWTHLAVVSTSDGNNCNLKLFINGKLVDSTLSGGTSCQVFNNSPQSLLIAKPPPGMGGISGYNFPGQIDEIRLSNMARYPGDFPVPTVPFAPDQNTLLLLHFDSPITCNAQTNTCSTPDSSGKGSNAKIVGDVRFVLSTVGSSFSHKECLNNACTQVPGAGSDKCLSDKECVSPPPPLTHRECKNNACVIALGPGDNKCSSDTDCAPPPPPPDPKAGYRFVTYTCNDGYKGNLGEKTSCKSVSTWKEYASSLCSQRFICPPPGRGQPCRAATLSDIQYSVSCDLTPPPPDGKPSFTATYPIGGITVDTLNPTFTWRANTTGLSYNCLNVHTDQCQTPIPSLSRCPTLSDRSWTETTALQPNTTYYWVIYGQPGWPAPGSGCQSFKTPAAPPPPSDFFNSATYECFNFGGLSSGAKTYTTTACTSLKDVRNQIATTCKKDLPVFCDKLASFFSGQCPSSVTPGRSCLLPTTH